MHDAGAARASAGERPLRIAIIGAGMAGILSAIKLDEAGCHDFVVYEKADRVGGTWRENTYPGVACDVPSHLYSYSFAPNPEWSHLYSPGAEIQAYFEEVARRYRVDERVRFATEIARCEFVGGRWHLQGANGLRDQADVVIAATGVLHHPSIPAIDGLDTFAGACFHSARWDHAVALDGRRVGVIGTGSTGVQIVSALAERVAKLTLFQRTAQWIAPQENPPYSSAEQEAFRRDPALMRTMHREMSRVMREAFANVVVDAASPQMRQLEATCLANLENNVRDPALREKLRPNYRAACKRLVISPDFYAAVQKPSVELVTEAIERIEAGGVRTRAGHLHALDVLVLATGFRVDRFMRPIHVIGRGGVRLDDLWAQRPVAYLSISIPGFPNLFMLNGPNGPVGNFSLIEVAELQIAYILQLLEPLRRGHCREISASESATAQFDSARVEQATRTVWATGCRSWYLDDRGIPAVWPWTFDRFCDEMAAPKPEAYETVR
ncbi:MAG: NAD(P)/FAD-dependent oxidoreductase [Candidatus Binatia bacterium]